MKQYPSKVDAASAETLPLAPAPRPSSPRVVAVASRDILPVHDLRPENPADTSQGRRYSTADEAAETVDGAAHDEVSTLTAQIGNLGIERASAAPRESAGPVPLRSIREPGPPLEDVQFCPALRIVTHASTWYYIADLPDSAGATLTCTRCYQDHIQHTALADKWTSVDVPEGSAAMCCFYTPRVKNVLWPQAVQANDMYELSLFLTRSASFEPCPGEKPITGVKGTTWYGLLGNEIDGFSACETCYEKYVAGTAFDDMFASFDAPAEENTWTCHLRNETIGRIVTVMAERDDWQGFIDSAVERLQLPQCTGDPVQSDSCGWYLARGPLRSAPVCATCYYDHLATTPFAAHFRKYSQRLDKFPSPGVWRCSLGTLATLVALEAALEQRDFDSFAATLKNIMIAPPCTAEGIVDGSWWTLAGGGCPEFAVCYACFAGIFWMRAMDGFLQPAAPPPGEYVQCSLHPSHPRFAQYFRKMYEAVDTGVFACFAEHVRRVASVRPCARNGGFANARWWGYPDSYFCEDCYVTYVQDTALGAHLPLNGDVLAEATFCQIWSPRMRHYWEEVCDAGAPGTEASDAALEDFLGVSRYRRKTYFETISEIETLKQMKAIQRKQAIFNGQMSIRYQGINSMASMFSSHRYEYGSNSLGWYESSAGVESKLLFDRFTSGLADSQLKPTEIQRILALQKIWEEVE